MLEVHWIDTILVPDWTEVECLLLEFQTRAFQDLWLHLFAELCLSPPNYFCMAPPSPLLNENGEFVKECVWNRICVTQPRPPSYLILVSDSACFSVFFNVSLIHLLRIAVCFAWEVFPRKWLLCCSFEPAVLRVLTCVSHFYDFLLVFSGCCT